MQAPSTNKSPDSPRIPRQSKLANPQNQANLPSIRENFPIKRSGIICPFYRVNYCKTLRRVLHFYPALHFHVHHFDFRQLPARGRETMKRVFLSMVAIFAASASTAQAGWWHHHHHHHQQVYAAPAYYVPAYAPTQVIQTAPQSGITDELLRRLLDKVIDGIGNNGSGGGGGDTGPTTVSVDMTEVRRELQELKSSVRNIEERVENVNSTLQRHGEVMVGVVKELEELKKTKAATPDAAPANSSPEEIERRRANRAERKRRRAEQIEVIPARPDGSATPVPAEAKPVDPAPAPASEQPNQTKPDSE